MYSYIYVVFLVIMALYFIYKNFLSNKKDKIIPYAFKKDENPLLFTLDIVMIVLLILGGYFFITVSIVPLLLLVFYIFIPIITLQTIILNFVLYRKTKNKKIIFKTSIYVILVVISLFMVVKTNS